MAVGLSVRNTDDCSFASGKSFLPWISEVVAEVKKFTAAPVFLGGIGFSILPEATLQATRADFGIEGDGEEALVALTGSLIKSEDFTHLPGMVYWQNGEVVSNPRADTDLNRLPVPRRRLFDNRRYQQLGAMVGVETKRGCPRNCIYCPEPATKGTKVRLRPPEIVVREIQDLLEQGVSWFYLCDSEFNLPPRHARDMCRAIIEKGLSEKIRWYTYCSPLPFDRELASLMKSAGCAGINFGVDSLCDEQLSRIGRTHSSEDVRQLVRLLDEEGINYMFDLLMGGPGETEQTVMTTIDKAREFDVSLVGIALGVRIYPASPLGMAVADGVIREGLYPPENEDPTQPLFYLSPSLSDNPAAMVNDLVGTDPRFLQLSAPGEEGSYNYADDEFLSRLIEQGARGAYWDILRQHRKA